MIDERHQNPMIDAQSELKRRVAELDAEPYYKEEPRNTSNDLSRFISVMQRITSSGSPMGGYDFSCTSARDADVIQKNCSLLDRLEIALPEITTEPLRLNYQFWVAIGEPSELQKKDLTLTESHFIGISDAPLIKASTKPFYVGLFTSTGVVGTYGMWRIYNKHYDYRISPPPPPLRTWSVEPYNNVVVREITSAVDWVEFILSNPRHENGLLYPDWKLIARQCDAIHMTLRAIVAIQGLYFKTEQGLIAPTYWDVESTFWFRWCFKAVKLVETVR